jgi:small-conductance mechanosensitive channel
MLHGLLFEEDSFGVFLLVTVALGGGAAWLSGRASAQTWRPWWSVVAYMLVLGLAVRFIHFSLFAGTLLSLHYYAVDTAAAILLAGLGFHTTRKRQMVRQYRFLLTGAAASAARQDAAP